MGFNSGFKGLTKHLAVAADVQPMVQQAVTLSVCQSSEMFITLCVQSPADGELTF